MSNNEPGIFERLIPFIMLGMGIAICIALLFLFSYVFVWGLLIGGVLWLVAMAKQYFFPTNPAAKEKGRVIEHEDKNK